MELKINKDLKISVANPSPAWVRLHCKEKEVCLSDFELRCLIAACEEAMKEREKR